MAGTGHQARGFGDVLIEKTRTPIPGERSVQLEGRKYNLFFEARTIPRPERVGDELSDLESSPLRIRIRDVGSDHLLQLKRYSGDFTMSGDRDATAFATVRVPHDGRYRISVASSDDLVFSEPSITLGEPIGGRVASVVIGSILAAAAFAGGLLLLIATLILRSRRRA
jgi:hypothetical protein